MENDNSKIVLRMENITKNFPGVKALDNVNITLKKGEILGLLGENGAGKSTLIKILSGDYKLEKGKIYIGGKEKKFLNPAESLAQGIRTIYQELTIFESLTVAENIFIGDLTTNKFGFVDWKQIYKKSMDLFDFLHIDLNPKKLVENLTIAEKQFVEIAKAIYKKTKILIMDEPTSALGKKDVLNLYKVVKNLKRKGVSIIYITHRIEEVFSITDRVIVLRDGKKVGDILTENVKRETLIDMIIGRKYHYLKKDIKKGKVILEVKNLSYSNIIKDVSFTLREGEIIAFFGLLGSGIHDLLSILFGNMGKIDGNIILNGKNIKVYSPITAKNNGLGYIPIDRKKEGLALNLSVKQNITSSNIEDLGNFLILKSKEEKEHANRWIENLNIKTPSINSIVGNLSGGNQQKVVVSRWLERNSKILLMSEPTRGIDVGAKVEIYDIISELCKKGVGILIASSELPEITSVSDRIYIMRKGEIKAALNTNSTTQKEIMRIASE